MTTQPTRLEVRANMKLDEANSLTQDELKASFDYDPETGEFRHKFPYSGQRRSTLLAGTVTNRGYVAIRIKKKSYSAHRLAWLYVYGNWPDSILDHINGNKTDNRLSNLRICTIAQNNRNATVAITNKSGFKGVSWDKASRKWRATIHINGRRCALGRFPSKDEAHQAYLKAARKLHGEFFCERQPILEVNHG